MSRHSLALDAALEDYVAGHSAREHPAQPRPALSRFRKWH